MNVKINLSEMLFSDDQKTVDLSNISNSSKENKELISKSLLSKTKLKQGYNSNRDFRENNGRIQWKSFNMIDLFNQPDWAGTERIELNKPYLSPLINTFESHKSIHKLNDKCSKKQMRPIPKRVTTNKVQVNLCDFNANKSNSAKSINSKQFKKTNIFALLNKEV